ncbi:hypothetical protein KI999_20905, partial [Escherichia marmotae]|uniref:hypothetical protein n=1 Tax=Escherichia marmotae TaxID=1499973 RepID=UPI002812BF07
FNKSKGVLITGSKLKAFRNPQPSWGFSVHNKKMAPYKAPFETDDKRNIARCATLIRPTRSLQSIGFERFVGRIRRSRRIRHEQSARYLQ